MLRALQRRGWVLLVTIVVAAVCAFLVASVRGKTYTAESTAVVAAASSPQSVLTPDQAGLLATTYAVLIPKDTAILHSVAATLGTSATDVQDRLSVFNTTGTAILAIDYRGTSAANSIAGATAVLAAISGPHPVSPNIIPRSVGAVQAPVTASSSNGVAVLVALGIIAGLALGLLLIAVWERLDPRIESPEDMSQEIGSPTSPVSAISQQGMNALVTRWKALAERAPSKIALVPVTADVQADLPEVAHRFTQARWNGTAASLWTLADGHVADSHELAEPLGNGAPVVITCEVPSADLIALEPIMNCDLVILVARKGTSRTVLRELYDSLTEFGVSPNWAIFLDARDAGARGRAIAR